jgi:hypothetical protein
MGGPYLTAMTFEQPIHIKVPIIGKVNYDKKKAFVQKYSGQV